MVEGVGGQFGKNHVWGWRWYDMVIFSFEPGGFVEPTWELSWGTLWGWDGTVSKTFVDTFFERLLEAILGCVEEVLGSSVARL